MKCNFLRYTKCRINIRIEVQFVSFPIDGSQDLHVTSGILFPNENDFFQSFIKRTMHSFFSVYIKYLLIIPNAYDKINLRVQLCTCKNMYVVVAQGIHNIAIGSFIFNLFRHMYPTTHAYVYVLYENVIIFSIFFQRHFINLNKLDTNAKLQTIVISISTQVLRMSSSIISNRLESRKNNCDSFISYNILHLWS